MKRIMLFAAVGLLTLWGLPAAGTGAGQWPENDQIKIIEVVKADCYIYQADCLRVTVMCKIFLPLGRPLLEVSWLDPDGKAFYIVVKHVAGTAHCNKGDYVHRYVPFFEGKTFTIALP